MIVPFVLGVLQVRIKKDGTAALVGASVPSLGGVTSELAAAA